MKKETFLKDNFRMGCAHWRAMWQQVAERWLQFGEPTLEIRPGEEPPHAKARGSLFQEEGTGNTKALRWDGWKGMSKGGKGEQTGRFGPFWFFQAIRKESGFYSTYNGRLLESSLEGNDKIGSTLRRSTLTTRENKINSRDKSGNQKMSWETTGVDQVTGDSDWGGGGGGETGGSGWIWATVRTWRTVYKKMGERKRRTVDILPVFGLRCFFFLNNMYIKIIPGGNITKR